MSDELDGILESETKLDCLMDNEGGVMFENIDLYAGSDRTIRVFVKTPDLSIVNLTGATGVLTVQTDKDAVTPTFQKSTAVGGRTGPRRTR